jgi:glutaredoxin-related protein|tara:strand:- start:9 stop:338 length:330 start_codon:yes stop_codon:yes gene_type:complete
MTKRLGASPVKVLFENSWFQVVLFDNNSLVIKNGTLNYQVCIQLDDTPEEFKDRRKRGHINISNFTTNKGKSLLDLYVNGNHYEPQSEQNHMPLVIKDDERVAKENYLT